MFEIGNIVEVINQDLQFAGAFGKVTEIKEEDETGHTVKVKIARSFSHMAGAFFREEGEQWYKPEELEVRDNYPPEVRADEVFRNMWHHVQVYTKPFDPNSDCEYETCTRVASKRCMINIWGTVCEVDLCQEHAEEFNGNCMDQFPWKPRKEVSVL